MRFIRSIPMRDFLWNRVNDFMFGHVLDCMDADLFHHVSGKINILERRIRPYRVRVKIHIEYPR